MEGFVMRTRYLIASAALVFAANAAAEPAKPLHPAVQPANRPAEVMMASADQVPVVIPASASDSPEAAPVKKPRAARVTTCRCAGQNQR
jgi:hypothetical protein